MGSRLEDALGRLGIRPEVARRGGNVPEGRHQEDTRLADEGRFFESDEEERLFNGNCAESAKRGDGQGDEDGRGGRVVFLLLCFRMKHED